MGAQKHMIPIDHEPECDCGCKRPRYYAYCEENAFPEYDNGVVRIWVAREGEEYGETRAVAGGRSRDAAAAKLPAAGWTLVEGWSEARGQRLLSSARVLRVSRSRAGGRAGK